MRAEGAETEDGGGDARNGGESAEKSRKRVRRSTQQRSKSQQATVDGGSIEGRARAMERETRSRRVSMMRYRVE